MADLGDEADEASADEGGADEELDAPLSTWEELRDWARDRFVLDADEEGWFATTVFWSDTPRSQQVRVCYFERSDGDPWIVLRSTVCRREQLDPEQALRHNDELAVATLALASDGTYELVYSFPLAALTGALLDDLVNHVAGAADDLEEPITGADEH